MQNTTFRPKRVFVSEAVDGGVSHQLQRKTIETASSGSDQIKPRKTKEKRHNFYSVTGGLDVVLGGRRVQLNAQNLNLTVHPGDDVTLSCRAPDVDIAAAEWSRTDLQKNEAVFLYRDGHIESEDQHPSFKNRVELKDREMKNGDLSVILKNVKKNDSGTYECLIRAAAAKRRKRAIIETAPISTIRLEVVDPALNLKAHPGDNVTLSCQAPDVDIAAAEWSRTDMKELEYVFLSVDGHIDSVYQHPSFKNRVELKDKEMKNGDLSVILKNVKKEDSGTYECLIRAAGAKRRKRAIIPTDPISIIRLEVVDPDASDGDKMSQDSVNDHGEPAGRVHPAVAVVLTLAVLIVVVSAVAAVMHRKQKASREHRQENREDVLAGGVSQEVERLSGNQRAPGSIPSSPRACQSALEPDAEPLSAPDG
ncbi:coxsackievirus and adenovirus receptor-like [Myripristis murdjan]|uniref:coxsackievirus and adenovirus receptor-like n=1 Tax=Myripristis murdjan TaxID=586833 RepID=UPI00117609BC|nr:coxsackievirus and adenovirus receptor-like [Myripristis murdjan]